MQIAKGWALAAGLVVIDNPQQRVEKLTGSWTPKTGFVPDDPQRISSGVSYESPPRPDAPTGNFISAVHAHGMHQQQRIKDLTEQVERLKRENRQLNDDIENYKESVQELNTSAEYYRFLREYCLRVYGPSIDGPRQHVLYFSINGFNKPPEGRPMPEHLDAAIKKFLEEQDACIAAVGKPTNESDGG